MVILPAGRLPIETSVLFWRIGVIARGGRRAFWKRWKRAAEEERGEEGRKES